MTTINPFADFLAAAIAQHPAPICVGLDPVLDRLPASLTADHPVPADALLIFSKGVIDAVAGIAPAVKFQSACYERYGHAGVEALEASISHARTRGLCIILDAKRGDIGVSSEHYAAAAAQAGAHAITVNGYLGPSGIAPFLTAGLGVFVLVRTSNPDSDTVQACRLADGRTVAELTADMVRELGERYLGAAGQSSVGAVVGATKAGEGGSLRLRMPQQTFLIPGYGAQGGTADDVRAMLTKDRKGVLVTASRSVIYPPTVEGQHWTDGVQAAAQTFAAEISQVIKT
jgi:orotidine-5'-phosphate decarboxylase